jgi:UTP:GlnB (protein PII) uridylyltransferase
MNDLTSQPLAAAQPSPFRDLLTQQASEMSSSQGAIGPQQARKLTEHLDRLVLDTFLVAAEKHGIRTIIETRACIAAVGGSGAQTTAALSDYDAVIFLQSSEQQQEIKEDDTRLAAAIEETSQALKALGIAAELRVFQRDKLAQMTEPLAEFSRSFTTLPFSRLLSQMSVASADAPLGSIIQDATMLLTARPLVGERAYLDEVVTVYQSALPIKKLLQLSLVDSVARHERTRKAEADFPPSTPGRIIKSGPGGLRDASCVDAYLARAQRENISLLSDTETARLKSALDILQTVKSALHLAQKEKPAQHLPDLLGLPDDHEHNVLNAAIIKKLLQEFPKLLRAISPIEPRASRKELHVIGLMQLAQKTIEDTYFLMALRSGALSERPQPPESRLNSLSENLRRSTGPNLVNDAFSVIKELATELPNSWTPYSAYTLTAAQAHALTTLDSRMKELRSEDRYHEISAAFLELLNERIAITPVITLLDKIGLLGVLVPALSDSCYFARPEKPFAPHVLQHTLEAMYELDLMLVSQWGPHKPRHPLLEGAGLAQPEFLNAVAQLQPVACRLALLLHDCTKHLGAEGHEHSAAKIAMDLATKAGSLSPWPVCHANASYYNDLVRRHHLIRRYAHEGLPLILEAWNDNTPLSPDLIAWRQKASALPCGAMSRGLFLENLLLITLADAAANGDQDIEFTRRHHEVYRALFGVTRGKSYSRETPVEDIAAAVEQRIGLVGRLHSPAATRQQVLQSIVEHRERFSELYRGLPAAAIAAHIDFIAQLRVNYTSTPLLGEYQLEENPFEEYAASTDAVTKQKLFRLVVTGVDRPALLSDLFGLVSKRGHSIIRAEVASSGAALSVGRETAPDAQHTNDLGKVACNVLWIRTPKGSLSKLSRELATDLTSLNLDRNQFAATCSDSVTQLMQQSAAAVTVNTPLKIDISPISGSKTRFKISIEGPDILGIAYLITRKVSELGLSISQAHLSGRLGKISDVFQVRASRALAPDTLEHIKSELEALLKFGE